MRRKMIKLSRIGSFLTSLEQELICEIELIASFSNLKEREERVEKLAMLLEEASIIKEELLGKR